MSMWRQWAGRIWAVYGLLVFFAMLLVCFPVYILVLGLLPDRMYRPVIWFNHHIYPRVFFALIGIRIRVHNRRVLRRGQQYVIVSNHRSAIDFLANTVAFPGVYKYLAKKELTRIPFLGFVVRKLCVLVDRANASSKMKSLEDMKGAFAEGYSLFVYPEGTRNRSGDALGPFYSGAFRLAVDLKVPVAVMTLQNVHHRSGEARSMDLWPGTLHIRWSGVVDPVPGMGHEALMKQTRELMTADLLP